MQAFAKPITTQVSRSPVGMGETFQIIYTLDGQGLDAVPDFSPLQKDFNVFATGKSSQFIMVNNKTGSVTEWEVNVSARRTGKLLIPAITFGDQTSEAMRIEVFGNQQLADQGQPQDIFMEVTVEAEHPYVQSQVIYSTRIYTATDIVNAKLSLPEANNVLFTRLGDDWRYTAERYGRLYQVMERRYAMFPETSGHLTIYAPIFSGISVESHSTLADPFFNKISAAPFQVQGANSRLKILPIPATYSATQWLPARQVQLQDSWEKPKQEIRVGEPITRTLTLQAEGVTKAQLPTLEMVAPEGMSVYPDNPITENKLNDGNIMAEKIQNFVYIPSEAGDVTLPAVQVDWWNVKTQQMEQTTLPALQLTVLPAIGTSPTDQASTMDKPTPSKPVALNDAAVGENAAAVNSSSTLVAPLDQWHGQLPWIVAASFALLWLTTVISGWLWVRHRRPLPSNNKPGVVKSEPMKAVLAALKHACQHNDPRAARQQLLAWANLQWPDHKITTLHEITNQSLQPELSVAIAQLNQALYDEKKPHAWQGAILWQAVQKILAHTPSQSKQTDELPPLYLE